MNKSESIATFAGAFVAAQAKMHGALKQSTNPHFRSRYADLAAVMDACRDALNEQGISVMQVPIPANDGRLCIETVLMHKSGEFISGECDIPVQKNDPQGYGSAMTYARRYALAAMAGVCPEDDDAEAAMGRAKTAQKAEDEGTDQLEDVNHFRGEVAAALKVRGFTADQMKSAFAAILESYHAPSAADLEVEQRHKVLNQIRTGGADKFKSTKQRVA